MENDGPGYHLIWDIKTKLNIFLTPILNKEIKAFDVVSGFKFHSDHRLIKCIINVEKWRYYKKIKEKTGRIKEEHKTKYCEKINEILSEIKDQNINKVKVKYSH